MVAVAALLITANPLPIVAQDETPTKVTNQNRIGDLPFSTSVDTDVEHVDIASGSLIVRIPIASTKGRGLDFDFLLRYDAHFFVTAQRVYITGQPYLVWNIENRAWFPDLYGAGWETNASRTTYGTQKVSCNSPNPNDYATYIGGYIYHDPNGGKHPLAYEWTTGGSCAGAEDVSGPDLTGQGIWATPGLSGNRFHPNVTLADGTQRAWKDSNGNQRGEGVGAVDSLGRTIVSQQNGTNQVLYNVYDSNGVLQTYTANYTTMNLQTNFNALPPPGFTGGIGEYSGSRKVITSIVLPNSRSYQFQYDAYGGITRIDLPTGGYLTYTWATLLDANRTYRYVASRTVNVNGQNFAWNFSHTGGNHSITVTVTDPLGNQSVYGVGDGAVESAKFYQGSATGTPLRQHAIDYVYDADPLLPFNSSLTYDEPQIAKRPIRITTTLDNGQVSKKEFDYETLTYPFHNYPCDPSCDLTTFTTSRGNVTEIREYDYGAVPGSYGSGTPGPLLRRTDKTYLHNANANYLTYNIVGKVLQETIYDGASNQRWCPESC